MDINNESKVCIILPVYNGSQYIRTAIQSILNQTYRDFEIIVVDDGSTDETYRLIEPWIKDGTVHYIHQNNKGPAVARNTGIQAAKGMFLKFLDYDDILYPQQLELQVRHLINKPDHYISVTDYEYKFENKTKKYVKISIGENNQLACFIQGNIGPIHSFLVRRSFVQNIGGFDEGLLSCEDTDLWLRLIVNGGFIERINYSGCCYNIIEKSVSSSPEKQLLNICKVYEKLNKSLLIIFNELSTDVLEKLLLTNSLLIHRCIKMKIKPLTYLPTALKMNQFIYSKNKNGLKKIVLTALGAQNIAFLKYIKAYLINPDYYKNLNVSAWRNG